MATNMDATASQVTTAMVIQVITGSTINIDPMVTLLTEAMVQAVGGSSFLHMTRTTLSREISQIKSRMNGAHFTKNAPLTNRNQ